MARASSSRNNSWANWSRGGAPPQAEADDQDEAMELDIWEQRISKIKELGTHIIMEMAATAKRWARRWQYKALDQSKQGFISWQAEQMSPEHNLKGVFGWVRKANQLPPLRDELIWKGENYHLPLDVDEISAQNWSGDWAPTGRPPE